MKLGLYGSTGEGATPRGATAIAEAAETAGFESIWGPEHVVVPSGYQTAYPYATSGKMAGGAEEFDLPDPLIWLAYVAARTTRLKLCTGILILPQRNALIAAKEIATLDSLSGGRVVLGIGVGWLAEEFAAIGVPFDDRGSRTDDAVAVMRKLWTGTRVSHDSPYAQFTNCISRPRPANGTIPIVIGGHSNDAARRAGRLGDGFFPMGTPSKIEPLLATMRRAAEDCGRDPSLIEVTAMCTERQVDAVTREAEGFAAVGVHRVIVPAGTPDSLQLQGEKLTSRLG